ncbi:efflux transporter outer membrane subunit [Ralstonia pseudosolanacearum]
MLLFQTERPLGIVALSLALAGCSLAPTYQRPEAPIPKVWGQSYNANVTSSATEESMMDWQTFVMNEGLRNLVAQALENNRDLRQTMLNVQAARAQYQVRRGQQLPSLEVQGSGSRQRVPGDLSNAGAAPLQQSFQANLALPAFELDFFGRLSNLSEAALQDYLATEEAGRSAQVALVSEVIQAYITRDGAQRRHELTTQTLKSREVSLELVARRRQAGASTALDYQEALGLTEQAKADLERTDREVQQATNALVLLVGAGSLQLQLPTASAKGAQLVQDVRAGMPSDLLIQRPDILAAERRLRARNADIGAARAAFFPRISLTGSIGSSSADLSNLFDSQQRAWSFMPQLSLPIFNGGQNRAALELAMVRKDTAVAAYEYRIQVAFREASDALAAIDTLRREEGARSALSRSSRDALRLAEARYRAGVDNHLRFLDAQRTAFANEISEIDVTTQRELSLVALFRAFGGGWLKTSNVSERAASL